MPYLTQPEVIISKSRYMISVLRVRLSSMHNVVNSLHGVGRASSKEEESWKLDCDGKLEMGVAYISGKTCGSLPHIPFRLYHDTLICQQRWMNLLTLLLSDGGRTLLGDVFIWRRRNTF
ncbi:Hypothetical predicted protein [Prunus dulcis]|uniref:Uncharacterized protein n=1 Tax=Prunus dulcis TaxID=3755 RepID=A0A5E4G5T2_PRUDU|nr:Hypothetical predicted protein [Prunus dulcis]